MDIKNIIKNEMIAYENSLMLNVEDSIIKTMVFVDNINLNSGNPVLAVVDMPVLNSVELVTLNESIKDGEYFNALTLIGKETIYCVWGNENIESLKNILVNFDYGVDENTVFLDIRKAYCDAYGVKELSLNCIVDALVDSKMFLMEELMLGEDVSIAKVMHGLMRFMLLDGYKNEEMNIKIKDALSEKKELYFLHQDVSSSFRKEKATLSLNKVELSELEEFSKNMIIYHEAMEDVYCKASQDNSISFELRELAREKSLVSRYKINAHKFALNSINANKENDFEEINIYFKSVELYSLIDDCMEVIKYIDSNDSLYLFVSELGASFMNKFGRTYSYLLRRNIVSEFTK